MHWLCSLSGKNGTIYFFASCHAWGAKKPTELSAHCQGEGGQRGGISSASLGCWPAATAISQLRLLSEVLMEPLLANISTANLLNWKMFKQPPYN